MFWRRRPLVFLVGSFFVIILAANVYFVYTVYEEWSEFDENYEEVTRKPLKLVKGGFPGRKNKGKERYYVAVENSQLTASANALRKIQKAAEELKPLYGNPSKSHKVILEKVLLELKKKENYSVDKWKIAEQWVTGTQVLPEKAPLLGTILDTLCSSKIIKAENSKKGTQLKVLVTLEGGQQALFKPQWYSRSEVIEGPVYAGKDRHNAEVAAFHLSLLLNLRRVPLTVGRKVNLRREIMPVATPDLLNTFYQDGNNTCFYGVCFYCEPGAPVCGEGDTMEGALIMWLPSHFRFVRRPHPWRRTYKNTLAARWEVEEDFCSGVKSEKEYDVRSSSLLLDLIDAAVFDFLLDNGDRHHYEVPSDVTPASIFFFDNGKGFGNPRSDHLDILAPLYQCCMIRKSTWERLKAFKGGVLGRSLEQTLKYSHIHPVLADSHLDALDRRLMLVMAAIEVCLQDRGSSNVLF